MVKKLKFNVKGTVFTFIALVGILLMLIYELGFYAGHRSLEAEKIIVWFYFTFIANVLGFIYGVLRMVDWQKTLPVHFQRFEILTLVNLTITFIVFGALLARTNKTGDVPLATSSNMIVHLITPVLLFALGSYEIVKQKRRLTITATKTTLINFLMPVIWLIVALIIYFAMGQNEDSAIYNFLDFKNHKVLTTIAIPAIALIYPATTFGLTYGGSRRIK